MEADDPDTDEGGSTVTDEAAWSAATPLEAKIERALALGVARGASEAFLARPTAEGGVGLTARAARSIARHRLGPDGQPGTADDGDFDSYADLDALPDVADTAIRRLRTFAWGAPFLQAGRTKDELAAAATPFGLVGRGRPTSASLTCESREAYAVRSVPWNPVSGCEPRERLARGTASFTLTLVETDEPLAFAFVGDAAEEGAGFYDVKGLAFRVQLPADGRRYEPVNVPVRVGGGMSLHPIVAVSAGHLDLGRDMSGDVRIGVDGGDVAFGLNRTITYRQLNDCGGGTTTTTCTGRTRGR